MITLENNTLKCQINPQNGQIHSLLIKHSGWQVIKRPKIGQGLQLLVPIEDRLNHRVYPSEKSQAEVYLLAEHKVTLSWSKMQGENDSLLPIAVDLVIGLNANQLIFTYHIKNDSPHTVETILFPSLSEISRPKEVHQLTRYNLFYGGLQKVSLFPHFRNEWGYWAVDHPIQMVPTPDSLFTLVQAGDEGLYFGFHDQESKQLLQFTFRSLPGYSDSLHMRNTEEENIAGTPAAITFQAEGFAFVQPGQTFHSARFVIEPYQGSWHKGVEIYKQWRKSWFSRPNLPTWVKEPHSWQQLQINSMTDELRYKYEQLPDIGKECARHGVGAIQLVGWTDHGQDGRTPTNRSDTRLGSKESLKKAIKKIQSMGVRVVLYSKYTFADVSTDWYRQELRHYASRDYFGNELTFQGYGYQTPAMRANINTRRLAIMCMHHPKWRHVIKEEFKRLLELDADGVLYDENMHHGIGRYCFAGDHNHDVPTYNFSGDVPVAKQLHKITDENNPDFLFAGEACFDLEHTCYGLSYFRILPDHLPGQRFIDPYLPMAVAVSGFDDREMINLCLLYRYIISYEPYNFKGRLEDFPKTLSYGKLVDSLRLRYQDYLWDANFNDVLGAQVIVNDKYQEKIKHTVFTKEDGKKAVAVANQSQEAITLNEVNIYQVTGSLFMVSPEKPDPILFRQGVEIPARSLVVIIEK